AFFLRCRESSSICFVRREICTSGLPVSLSWRRVSFAAFSFCRFVNIGLNESKLLLFAGLDSAHEGFTTLPQIAYGRKPRTSFGITASCLSNFLLHRQDTVSKLVFLWSNVRCAVKTLCQSEVTGQGVVQPEM